MCTLSLSFLLCLHRCDMLEASQAYQGEGRYGPFFVAWVLKFPVSG
jgi:hypothetical protein